MNGEWLDGVGPGMAGRRDMGIACAVWRKSRVAGGRNFTAVVNHVGMRTLVEEENEGEKRRR